MEDVAETVEDVEENEIFVEKVDEEEKGKKVVATERVVEEIILEIELN